MTLIDRARRVAAAARAGDSLETLPTHTETLEAEGTRFLLRELEHLERKRALPKTRGNPFLPPEPELTVGPVGDTHLCVLNKFNVVDLHLLLITREYEDQQDPLTLADFDVLCLALREVDGLAFYNSGPAAGASQPHRHLQLVPTPLGEGPERFPLEARYASRERLGFEYAAAPTPAPDDAPAHAALYASMLDELRLTGAQPAPYNLLVTRDATVMIPRTRESHHGISVNALGFAGSLFVNGKTQRDALLALGPFALLRGVARTS